MSTFAPRSPSFKFTSGSENTAEPAHGYTSAIGSEYATTGLGLGFRIRTKLGHGNSIDTSRAASVRVGLLCAPNSFTGPRVTSPPVSLPPAIRTSLDLLSEQDRHLLLRPLVLNEVNKFSYSKCNFKSPRPMGLPRDRPSLPLAAPSIHHGLLSRKPPLRLRLLRRGCRETMRDVPSPSRPSNRPVQGGV
ncbi:hypothetical protein BC826DRAFT_585894 [Russula brevipes]|nr:hypothetical protein BC826DRAFT_585894 [Russula brevipes]